MGNGTLDDIHRRDVEQRFHRLTERTGWGQANIAVKLLAAIYRRPCLDFEDLRNPVALWRAGGGRLHRPRRRRIRHPAEVLPCWHRGFETAVRNPVARDAFRFGLYTGMRLTEVISLAWLRVDMEAMTVRIDDTKRGEPLEFPVTRYPSTSSPGTPSVARFCRLAPSPTRIGRIRQVDARAH